jgi:hypothetical protein
MGEDRDTTPLLLAALGIISLDDYLMAVDGEQLNQK